MSKRDYQNNYVPALKDPPSHIVEVEIARELPQAPTTVLMPHAGYEDRAKGFGLATAPLAGVAGLVAALVGMLGWQVPFASLVTLLLALGGFSLVWLIAYVAHTLISPDGTTFAHTFLAWRYLRAEQKERFKRYHE
jgi:phage shock protein PspC (stress-responsive transcriptional regulator)